MATASGGLWKTVNRGLTFQPIFDDGGSYSLGCVTVDPKNPDIVWLGTGENQAQRAIGYGDGIYKSTDAGKTMEERGPANRAHRQNLGWTRAIRMSCGGRAGPLFSPGGDRGLYKTTDGGATWKPSLTITENTGVTDFDVDPRNPDIMYAAAYQRRRTTSIVVAGGPDSGIFKSTDAGGHWTRLTEGIPTVDKGRIALAVSPQKPDTIYATITTNKDNKLTGMYRSDDAGAHWAKLNDFIVQDPEYYGEIFADPFKEGRVYLMDMAVRVSEDTEDDHRRRLAGTQRQPFADLRPYRPQSSDRRQRRRPLRILRPRPLLAALQQHSRDSVLSREREQCPALLPDLRWRAG